MLKKVGIVLLAALLVCCAIVSIITLQKVNKINRRLGFHGEIIQEELKKIKICLTSEDESFSVVYRDNIWGGGSGSGSDPKNAKPYLELLQKYLTNNEIKTVVDLGCGDWRLMKTLSIPDSIQYKGFDLVESVISNNIRLHKKKNISFIKINSVKDIVEEKADLLIIKDVMQHWPNNQICFFLKNILPNFKYAIITNDHDPKSENSNISQADYRPINLEADPFNLVELKFLMDYVSDTNYKRVYLYINPNFKLTVE